VLGAERRLEARHRVGERLPGLLAMAGQVERGAVAGQRVGVADRVAEHALVVEGEHGAAVADRLVVAAGGLLEVAEGVVGAGQLDRGGGGGGVGVDEADVRRGDPELVELGVDPDQLDRHLEGDVVVAAAAGVVEDPDQRRDRGVEAAGAEQGVGAQPGAA
jgi:hypothetical protein